MDGAGHAQVADIARAAGQNLAVGCGHMGVGAPEGGDLAVQIVAHGQLFTGGLGVEIHQGEEGAVPVQQPGSRGEGVVRVEVHAAAANQIQHADLDVPAGIDPPAPARHAASIVGGPQQIGVLLHPARQLQLAEGVVAQGDHVRPRLVELLHLPGQDAGERRILPVDHGEVDVLQLFQAPQAAGQMGQALLPHHVANGQNMIDQSAHDLSRSSCDCTPSIPAFPRKSNIAMTPATIALAISSGFCHTTYTWKYRGGTQYGPGQQGKLLSGHRRDGH